MTVLKELFDRDKTHAASLAALYETRTVLARMTAQAYLAFLILPWCSVYSNLGGKEAKDKNTNKIPLEINGKVTPLFLPCLIPVILLQHTSLVG